MNPYIRRKTITVEDDGGVQRYVALTCYLGGEFGFAFKHEGQLVVLPAAVLDRFVSQRDSIRGRLKRRG